MSEQPEPQDPEKLRALLLKATRLALVGADLLSPPPAAESPAEASPPSAPESAAVTRPPAGPFPPTTGRQPTTTWARIDRFLAPVAWDWPGWLPPGFLTVLASEPGTGKSLLCLHLAATYLQRRPWPDGTPFSGEPGYVLWCESESSHALNLQRARAWELDLERILTPLKRPLHNFKLDDPRHMRALLALSRRDDVRLVVLDSLRGLRRGLRQRAPLDQLLEGLADLARIAGKPFLLTHHLRKRNRRARHEAVTLDHLLGTSAISQVARLVWALDTPDPVHPEHRRLSVIKSNLAPLPPPVGFHIRDDGLRFGPPPEAGTAVPQIERALALLRHRLAAGPLPFGQVQAAYQAAGLSERTIRRAKKQLAIRSYRPSGTAEWYWALPGQEGQP